MTSEKARKRPPEIFDTEDAILYIMPPFGDGSIESGDFNSFC